jgi:hypothetical protein
LERFYNEVLDEDQTKSGDWICPGCRGICACAGCRRTGNTPRYDANNRDQHQNELATDPQPAFSDASQHNFYGFNTAFSANVATPLNSNANMSMAHHAFLPVTMHNLSGYNNMNGHMMQQMLQQQYMIAQPHQMPATTHDSLMNTTRPVTRTATGRLRLKHDVLHLNNHDKR